MSGSKSRAFRYLRPRYRVRNCAEATPGDSYEYWVVEVWWWWPVWMSATRYNPFGEKRLALAFAARLFEGGETIYINEATIMEHRLK